MSLPTLPAELLLPIARALLYCPTCHCHHVMAHLSALVRSNQLLHARLRPYLLDNASPLQMLLWAIANTRHDILALALSLGADPSTRVHQLGINGITRHLRVGTPVDIAIAMHAYSPDALLHSRKLTTISHLLAAGGTVSVYGLTAAACDGDLDVLALCLPQLPDVNAPRDGTERRTLLENAARCGHVRAVKMLIRAGAAVNSTGVPGSPGFFPPLWECWDVSVAVLQVLLDAGADAKWRAPDGESIVLHVRRLTAVASIAAVNVELLLRYGALDERPASRVTSWRSRGPWDVEYTGWVRSRGDFRDWAEEWTEHRGREGCGCPVCPMSATRGWAGVRELRS